MLQIGDFSKICQISAKALRYWDKIDLLRPAHTDPTTGYRYYKIEQIDTVNRILAFRSMGLEAAQIRELLQDNLTTEDIRAMLRLKQVELQQQIQDTATMLRRVETRLQQIDAEGSLPTYEVTLKSIEPQEILAIRGTIPTMEDLVDLLRETHAYSLKRTGTNLLAVFHDTAYLDEVMDVEIGFPITSGSAAPLPLTQNRRMTPVQLPGVEAVATTVHKGPWLDLSHGYVHLGCWIEKNGYEISGAGREIFHHIDWEEGNQTVTELQFPVRKRS